MKKLLLALAAVFALASPAYATWSRTAVASCGATGGASTCTTGSVSTSGADLFVCFGSYYEASAGATNGDMTDSATSPANVYTAVQPTPFSGNSDGALKLAMYYKIAPTTSGSMTFTYTGPVNNGVESVSVVCYAMAQGSSPSLQGSISSNTTSGTGPTTIQAGSIGSANDIVLTGIGYYANNSQSINSSFEAATEVSYSGGNHIGAAGSWKEVSGAVNPTWSVAGNNSTTEVAMSIAFTGTGGGGGGGATRYPRNFGLLGVASLLLLAAWIPAALGFRDMHRRTVRDRKLQAFLNQPVPELDVVRLKMGKR